MVKTKLNDITLFHTDRGNEFKNKLVDEGLEHLKSRGLLV